MDGLKDSNLSRRRLMAAAGGSFASLAAPSAPAEIAAGFPASITSIPFGAVSHWLQPWRELCQTRPFDAIAAGIGITVNGYQAQQDALDMLRHQGIRHVRVEIGWGQVDPQTESMFRNQAVIEAYLSRLRKAGLRPLILLNANDGNPCPSIAYPVTVAADAAAGAQSMMFASTAGMIPGRSGFSHFGRSPLGSVLATKVDGQQVSLSKPLPAAILSGTIIQFVTLSYEPFSAPGSARNERTMLGWLRYVDLVCQAATRALGTAEQTDRGFDLEVWNELTFGSAFLGINNYYNPPLTAYNSRDIVGAILQRTAAHISAAASCYRGVRVSDGFGSTLPWPAASLEPPRISAISKHPYPPADNFPKNEQPHSVALDAFGRKTAFIPRYAAYFPEYFANVVQTESLCRDVADQPNTIFGTAHGRRARRVNGQVSLVDLWITEIGCAPAQWGIEQPAAAARLLTLFVLRSLFFHLCIGVERVYLFEAFGNPGSLALVNQARPAMPSMALICIARMLAAIRGDPGNRLHAAPTPVIATAHRNPADLHLFEGSGAPNLPPMTTADALVLLPVQSSANHIAIIYYIMTRDVRIPLAPQNLNVSIQAKNIQRFAVSSYDPLTDQYTEITQQTIAPDLIALELAATDIPKLLRFSL